MTLVLNYAAIICRLLLWEGMTEMSSDKPIKGRISPDQPTVWEGPIHVVAGETDWLGGPGIIAAGPSR